MTTSGYQKIRRSRVYICTTRISMLYPMYAAFVYLTLPGLKGHQHAVLMHRNKTANPVQSQTAASHDMCLSREVSPRSAPVKECRSLVVFAALQGEREMSQKPSLCPILQREKGSVKDRHEDNAKCGYGRHLDQCRGSEHASAEGYKELSANGGLGCKAALQGWVPGVGWGV